MHLLIDFVCKRTPSFFSRVLAQIFILLVVFFNTFENNLHKLILALQ